MNRCDCSSPKPPAVRDRKGCETKAAPGKGAACVCYEDRTSLLCGHQHLREADRVNRAQGGRPRRQPLRTKREVVVETILTIRRTVRRGAPLVDSDGLVVVVEADHRAFIEECLLSGRHECRCRITFVRWGSPVLKEAQEVVDSTVGPIVLPLPCRLCEGNTFARDDCDTVRGRSARPAAIIPGVNERVDVVPVV